MLKRRSRSIENKQSAQPIAQWLARGEAHLAQGRLGEATEAFQTLLRLDPNQAAGHRGLAEVCRREDCLAEALDHCRTAVALGRAAPASATYATAGRVLSALGQQDDALAAFSSAIQLEPVDAEAYVGLGLIFEERGQPLDAFAAYRKALDRCPGDARVYNNLAAVLVSLRQFELAIATARTAVRLAPDHPDIYLNLATALRLGGQDAEALATYETIVALKPDHGEALVELCHRRQHACDWDGWETLHQRSLAHSYRQGRLVSPFSIMTATDAPVEQLLCARVWGARLAMPALAAQAPRPIERRGERIRLGYLSADFHNHATAMLIADMLETHDRSRFALFGYSLGPDDGSAIRRRLAAACDQFVDLQACSDDAAARRIHEDGIDILLDLKGYTQNARVKIMARRPAPIQINYLGFPGTMGAPFIDYIVADPHVAPFAHGAFFDEKIIHLPYSYQPNDRKRVTAAGSWRRADFGLPETGFVFCCFNGAYKITPAIFAIWTRLLAATPGSVLWLLETNGEATKNLRREACRHGIDATRLVFAPFIPADRHLARLALADLFLDTFPVNAHTTASEALWVGLPIVTMAGESFASRVACSLLNAVGLSELVTMSFEAYESLALSLVRDTGRLKSLRTALVHNRLVSPLFDTPRYTRDFEKAMETVIAFQDAGDPPRAFAVME